MSGNMDNKIVTIRAFTKEKGLGLYFCSPIFESFFKGRQEGLHENGSWGKGKLYYSPPAQLDFYCFQTIGGRLFEGNSPNLSFLLAKGISNGVEFTVKNTVVTEKIMDKYIEDAKKEISKIYKLYMRPISIEESIEF